MRTIHHRPFNLGRDVETLLNGFFDMADTGSTWLPRVDVSEHNDALTVRFAVPGYRSDDLNITVEDNTVTVTGTAEVETPEGTVQHRQEIQSGSFSRSIRVPKAYDSQNISASYRDGVLELGLTKRPEVAPRTVEISTD